MKKQNWCILELPVWSETDYSLNIIEKLPILNIKATFTYNQLEYIEYWPCLCTAYWPMTMYANNTFYDIQYKERKDIIEKRIQINFDKNTWGYLVDWVKTINDYYNKCVYYRVNKEQIIKLIALWYTVNIWLYWWNDLKSAGDDGEITEEEIKSIKDNKYWHSTCIKWSKRLNSYKNGTKIIDSLYKFINSRFVYDWGFVMIPNRILLQVYSNEWDKKPQWKLDPLQAITDEFGKENNINYAKEKKIFQYATQLKCLWKINSEDLKLIKF